MYYSIIIYVSFLYLYLKVFRVIAKAEGKDCVKLWFISTVLDREYLLSAFCPCCCGVLREMCVVIWDFPCYLHLSFDIKISFYGGGVGGIAGWLVVFG